MSQMEEVLQISVDGTRSVDTIIRYPIDKTAASDFGVLITHGAGGDMNSKQLLYFVDALSTAGFLTVRFTCKPPNFGYRVKCYTSVFEYCKSYLKLPGYILAGRSMGARVAAQVAANKAIDDMIYGIACISYPLHCPKQQDKLRTCHLVGLTCPIFIMNGENDKMCKKELMEHAISTMNSTITMKWVSEADHSLNFGKSEFEEKVGSAVKQLVEWCYQVFSLQKS